MLLVLSFQISLRSMFGRVYYGEGPTAHDGVRDEGRPCKNKRYCISAPILFEFASYWISNVIKCNFYAVCERYMQYVSVYVNFYENLYIRILK